LVVDHHYMQLPREVLVGKGVLHRVSELLRRLGLDKSALIVTGKRSYEVAGCKVGNILQEEGMDVDTCFVEAATLEAVLAVGEKITFSKPQVVVAVGGGTKIDVAKLSSARMHVPFISVPSTVAHDGIASPLAAIKGFDRPFSVMAQAPLAIIADTEVIGSAPWRTVISGCGDVIAKLTAVRDWRLAHSEKNEYYGEYAASLALMSARLVVQNAEALKPRNSEALRVLIEALISCGVAMSIAGSSRPASGSEHLFSHALDALNCHAMHGEQCGVGTIMAAYLHGMKWEKIRETLRKVGAPTTASELGVKDEDVVAALEAAPRIRPDRYTILHKLMLDRDACRKVARETGVIG
jgi:glycerol-1-phosphate dehydrogenase [NAD(P)+]